MESHEFKYCFHSIFSHHNRSPFLFFFRIEKIYGKLSHNRLIPTVLIEITDKKKNTSTRVRGFVAAIIFFLLSANDDTEKEIGRGKRANVESCAYSLELHEFDEVCKMYQTHTGDHWLAKVHIKNVIFLLISSSFFLFPFFFSLENSFIFWVKK